MLPTSPRVLGLVLIVAGSAGAGVTPDRDSAPGTAAHIPGVVREDGYTLAPPNGVPTPQCRNDDAPDLYQAIDRVLGLLSDEPDYLQANRDADPLWVAGDELWKGKEAIVVLLGGTARYRDALGIYTDEGSGRERIPLFDAEAGFGFRAEGTPQDPYPAARIPFKTAQRFGWYLDVDGSAYGVKRACFFSESRLNPLGRDHMFTYRLGPVLLWVNAGDGPEPVHLDDAFLLGWEDTGATPTAFSDDDYDDVMFLVGEPSLFALR